MTMRQYGEEYAAAKKRAATAKTELQELQGKRTNAEEQNENEIEARASAMAEDADRPDKPLIEIAGIDADIAVQERLIAKLLEAASQKRGEQSRYAEALFVAKRQAALDWARSRGFDGNTGFADRTDFDKVSEMTVGELLEVAVACSMHSVGHQYEPADLLADFVRPISDNARRAARTRVEAAIGLG